MLDLAICLLHIVVYYRYSPPGTPRCAKRRVLSIWTYFGKHLETTGVLHTYIHDKDLI